MEKSLASYRKKRRFNKTKEPIGKIQKRAKKDFFVIQKHAAKNLHFDLRLEIDGTLKSWAVPKGPSLSTREKRLAILMEDHPLEYGNFEGVVPKGEYGAGVVMLWDRGKYQNIKKDDLGELIPMKKCFKLGSIEIWLKGKKIKGGFALIHFREKNWLLIKMKDEMANTRKNLAKTANKSVKSDLTMQEIKNLYD
jgi:DNA ligase D-like protein (predicted 3'-phosphoesterase)